MAKRKKEDVETAAEVVAAAPDAAAGPTVLVFQGHDNQGGLTSSPCPVDLSFGERFQPNSATVHIGGVAYVHIADTADGEWIYAPSDVRKR